MTGKAGKSNVKVPQGQRRRLRLAGDTLETRESIAYIGFTINLQGMTEGEALRRIRTAQDRRTEVTHIESRIGQIPTPAIVTLYTTVARPRTENGIHLCIMSFAGLSGHEKLESWTVLRALGKLPASESLRA